MNTLQLPDQRTSILLGENKGIKKGDPVRPSQFAVVFDYGEKRVLYNTFTCQCVETDRLEWFEKSQEMSFDPDNTEMAELVQADFLVADSVDEAERYGKVLDLLRKMSREKPGYTAYTILPTTACNARCVYCYEAGIPFETMDDAMAEQVVRYICATKRQDATLTFHWFGGEPLMGEAVIDKICAAMRDKDIKYHSSMISNGSLVTEALAKKAKEDWHLDSVQITLDGREEMYCERKRYVSFNGSPYRAVLDGIRALLEKEIRVRIRLNVDEENMEEMYALADELAREFPDERGVSIYSHSIYLGPGRETCRDDAVFYDELEKLNERLRAFNIGRNAGRDDSKEIDSDPAEEEKEEDGKESSPTPRGRTKRYFCMADAPQGSPAITPSGKIYICEHVNEVPAVGDIRNGRPIERGAHVERRRLEDRICRTCPMLPYCTDFSGCPVRSRDCCRETLAREKWRMEIALRKATTKPSPGSDTARV